MTVAALTAAGLAYMGLVWWFAPKRVMSAQFFHGSSASGSAPTFWLLVASSAISWIFAKSIVNSGSLTYSFGLWGGFGYSLYYLSFIVVAASIYLLRVHGGYRSLSDFLVRRYGVLCMRLFLIAVCIRLFNEVWSNTKVVGMFFGAEGTAGYWLAVVMFTAFSAWYSIRGGLFGSLVTDGVQMLLAVLLLLLVLGALAPQLNETGLPLTTPDQVAGGITFALLALVQVFSYGFHDPVMTDRAFITSPKRMLYGFIVAAAVGMAFIILFGLTGSFARSIGTAYNNVIYGIGGAVSLPLLLAFSVLMLTSAGSTLDSTFSSTAKLRALDWKNASRDNITFGKMQVGRLAIILIAVLGNLPLLSLYFGDQVGPAIIKATTVSGTMVMGLAPVFLLCFLRRAGRLSFHLSFWCGLLLGVLLAVGILPPEMALGSGKYALSLGVNVFGLALCTVLYLLGAIVAPNSGSGEKYGNAQVGSAV